jgi:hypothetical protein
MRIISFFIILGIFTSAPSIAQGLTDTERELAVLEDKKIALALLDDNVRRDAFLKLMAAAKVSVRRCDNMRLNYHSMVVEAQLSNIYEPTESEIDQAIPAMEMRFDVDGAVKWCAEAWKTMGPGGLSILVSRP